MNKAIVYPGLPPTYTVPCPHDLHSKKNNPLQTLRTSPFAITRVTDSTSIHCQTEDWLYTPCVLNSLHLTMTAALAELKQQSGITDSVIHFM